MTIEGARARLGDYASDVIDDYLLRQQAEQPESAEAPELAELPEADGAALDEMALPIADNTDARPAVSEPEDFYAHGREALERELRAHMPERAEAMLKLYDLLVENYNPDLGGAEFFDRIGWRFGGEFEGGDGLGQRKAPPNLGPRLKEFRHNPKGAIARLSELQSGDAIGALQHPEIGDIDLIWGEPGRTDAQGYGLSKILRKHPEVIDDLGEIIAQGTIYKQDNRKIYLMSADKKAIVSLDWYGEPKRWLLTAYTDLSPDPTGSRMDIPGALKQLDDTATQLRADDTSIIANSGVLGLTRFTEDMNGLVNVYQAGDVHTFAHETIHAITPYMRAGDAETLRMAYMQAHPEADIPEGWHKEMQYAADGEHLTPVHADVYEWTSRGFENFLATGKHNVPELAGIFERIKAWMVALYERITGSGNIRGSEIDIEVSPAVNEPEDFYAHGWEALERELCALGRSGPRRC